MRDLRDIFTDDMLQRLRSTRSKSNALDFRLQVLTASRAYPSDMDKRYWIDMLLVNKAAWDTYISAAFAIGLFDGEHGKELQNRLTSRDDDNFRSAWAECLSAWYLAGKQGFQIGTRPIGRPGHPLEFCIRRPNGDINVEVKAPYNERSQAAVWVGNDEPFVEKALTNANKQFKPGVRNLLIIVPQLRVPIYTFRNVLTHAFYGEDGIGFLVDTEIGGQVGPTYQTFNPNGRFLRTDKGKHRFTRVSGILCIEEERGDDRMLHKVLLAHNPHAECPLDETDWKDIPQFVARDGNMIWTDGKSAFVPETVEGPGLF